MLRTDRPASAPLDALERASPGNLQVFVLRAEQLRRQGRQDEAHRRWADRLERTPSGEERLALLLAGADWFDASDRPTVAEEWLRRTVEIDRRLIPRLTRHLLRNGNADGAVAVCLNAWSSQPELDAALALLETLIQSRPVADPTPEAAAMLATAETQFANHGDFLKSWAAWQGVQGRLQEAAQACRRALRSAPRDSMLLNNLAWYLVHQPQERAQGRQWAERAREIGGDHPSILDTLACAELLDQRPREALNLLAEVEPRILPDAGPWLHLAIARARVGDAAGSLTVLLRAKSLGVTAEPLTIAERAWLEELERPAAAPGGGS